MNGDSIQRGLLLALLAFLQPSLKADSIPEIVAKAKPAIVEIVTSEAKSTRKILDTGFFVSPDGLVVTNQHVEGQNLNFAIPAEKVPAALLEPPGSAPPIAILTPAADANAYFDSGLAFLNKKQYDEAIGDFSEAIRVDPTYTLAYFNRGLAYDNKGNYDKAVSDYTEAIRLNPNDSSILSDRGDAYHSQNRLDEAVCDYTDAIRLNPNNANAYVNRGIAYSDQGKLDAAISDFTDAIRLDPNNADAYKNRGSTYLRAGDNDKAYADFATVGRLKSRPIKDVDSPPK